MNITTKKLTQALCVGLLLLLQVTPSSAATAYNRESVMLFAGRAEIATITPDANHKDLYIIAIPNVKEIVAFTESPRSFADKIATSTLAEKLWRKQILNGCLIGRFNMDNGQQERTYVFELSKPSYNKTTKTLTMHASSLGGKNLKAFASTKPVTVKHVTFFIDPITLGGHWNGL